MLYFCSPVLILVAASIVFRNLLQKESRDSIFVQTGTIELLLPVLEGAHRK